MTTLPDISVVQLPAFEPQGTRGPAAPPNIRAVELPPARRPSPLTLAVLGVLAGIAAMAAGSAAVISAGRSADASVAAAGRPSAPAGLPTASDTERRALALLAKPSTERVAFRGARGLVLAVGSGGRAAILIGGFRRASGKPYTAWVVRPGIPPVRSARFVGTEHAVFLAQRLGPRASVVVSSDRPVAGAATGNRVVAFRG